MTGFVAPLVGSVAALLLAGVALALTGSTPVAIAVGGATSTLLVAAVVGRAVHREQTRVAGLPGDEAREERAQAARLVLMLAPVVAALFVAHALVSRSAVSVAMLAVFVVWFAWFVVAWREHVRRRSHEE